MISEVINENKLDVLGISEANLWREDDFSQIKVKNYEVVNDKLLTKHGRARSMMYVRSNLKYKIRTDLMHDDTPEVWLELPGKPGENPLLVSQFYREHTVVRGKENVEGSDSSTEQKNRLLKWIEKTAMILENEKKEILIGGDFNADTRLHEGDILGKILKEDLMDSRGMEMIVNEPTHQK